VAEPELRAGPPWVTEEMVAAQPALARALLDTPPDGLAAFAATLSEAFEARLPVSVVGCGTSEHGAMAIAELLSSALGGGWPRSALARQSLDAAEDPQRGGVCIGVSHDGGTYATTLALEAAAAGGATTALVTNAPDGPTAAAAEILLVTPVHDDSYCHTVAYASSILVGAGLARELGMADVDGEAAAELLRDTPSPDAAALAGSERVLVAGAGLDSVTARELALKLAEGARLETAALHLETLLHGHLAGEDAGTGIVFVDTERDSGRVRRRTDLAERAVAELGMLSLRIGPPVATVLAEPVARLLSGAAALQALTLGLVRARGVNPDLIRREDPAYRRAADVAEGAADW
jgi:glucosamine--fructose-6-phosphate aminotransferase (isomerizing)